WTVVNGDEVMRIVRSPQTGEVTTTRVITTELDSIQGEISVIRLSNSGAQAAMIIGGEVYIGVVERERSGDFRLTNVYNPASELGGTALSLDWQADGSLVVGTSTQEAPVWRVEQDGSSVSILPSGNITIPVVSIAASPSTLYIPDYHSMLQLPLKQSPLIGVRLQGCRECVRRRSWRIKWNYCSRERARGAVFPASCCVTLAGRS